MAQTFVASDHRTDPYVLTTLPKVLEKGGHSHTHVFPLENLVVAIESSAAAFGGSDFAILVHSTPIASGIDGPQRVMKKIRELSDVLLFRNAVKAKSIPALVIAKNKDLAFGEAKELSDLGWVEILDPSTSETDLQSAIKNLIFSWRTDLLKELECVGYAVTIGPTGYLDVKPTFAKKKVEGEIIKATVKLTALQKAKYVVLSSDIFKAASSYRHLAYLLEHYRIIAKAKGTKPEEVFQQYFEANPDFLFAQGFAQLFPEATVPSPRRPGQLAGT